MTSKLPPAMDIIGNIDSTTLERDPLNSRLFLTINGWLLHTEKPIEDLYFEVKGAVRSNTTRNQRPDIQTQFPDLTFAKDSGYSVKFEFPDQPLETPLMVDFFATLAGGQKIATTIEVPLALPAQEPPAETSLGSRECAINRLRQIELRNFLSAARLLEFPQPISPQLSVIIVTFNKAADTFSCLTSLLLQATAATEVIVVDNNSSDLTSTLLASTKNLRIIKNSDNMHFLRAARQGAEIAAGNILLFLNNDAVLLPGALEATQESFKDHPNLGALGARLIHLTGELQEVGGIIFPDGSNKGIGVGEHALAVPFLLQRSVDYCSGAFLATPSAVWKQVGGFDVRYVPAYYEDLDYCVSVKQLGLEVIVEPRIAVLHAEGATGDNSSAAKNLMLLNRARFVDKNRAFLSERASKASFQQSIIPPAVADHENILLIDDFFPLSSNGQGAPRAKLIVDTLISQGCRITFVALNETEPAPADLLQQFPLLRCRTIKRGDGLLEFLCLHGASYGTIIISRPHNMEDFDRIRSQYPICAGNARVIYDAEAIFALREIRNKQLIHKLLFSAEQIEKIVSQEILAVKHADQFWAVSEAEAQEFVKRGLDRVRIINFGVSPEHPPENLPERGGALFIGPILNQDTPNGEGFLWFTNEVLPLLHARSLENPIKITHAGVNRLPVVNSDSLLISCGQTRDLTELYRKARVFIAPVRFGSGIPLKVVEAASHGVPIVTTSYVAGQLGWQDEHELLIADDATLFCKQIQRLHQDDTLWFKIRENMLKRVRQEFSLTDFQQNLLDSLALSSNKS